jgi:hypothetical protein
MKWFEKSRQRWRDLFLCDNQAILKAVEEIRNNPEKQNFSIKFIVFQN